MTPYHFFYTQTVRCTRNAKGFHIVLAENQKKSGKGGFTLIEVLVYLGLYAIVMTGALVAAHSLFESSEHNITKAMVQEEGSFLIGKVDWALTGAKTINLPASGASGSTLSITKFDTSAPNPIVIALSGGNITLQKGAGVPVVVNNSNVFITALSFTHTAASGDGTNPESLSASLTLHATTSDGLPFNQTFSTVKFLRK